MRHDDCYQRLHNLWLTKKNEPFRWGKHDCLVLALQAIEAITDKQYPFLKKYMQYNSMKGAYKLLVKKSLQQRVTSALKPFFATITNEHNLQSGDLVLIKSIYTKEWNALAIVDLCPSGFVLPAQPRGLMRINRKNATVIKAWHII